MQKRAIVCGGGGFIGGHLVERLKSEGFWVRAVDLKKHEYRDSPADEFLVGDLREQSFVRKVVDQQFDEVYQLAADMGGAGYIFTGENDANIMHNSALINLNVLEACVAQGIKRVFYSSSACIQSIINSILIIPIVKRVVPTQRIQIVNMGGRNYFQKDYISRSIEIMEWSAESRVITISLDLTGLGQAVKRKPQLPCAEK